MKLTKNSDHEKYGFRKGIKLDAHSQFQGQMVNGVKMLLVLKFILVLPGMLIEKKDTLITG